MEIYMNRIHSNYCVGAASRGGGRLVGGTCLWVVGWNTCDGHEEMGGRNRRKREGKRKTIDRRTRWIDLYPAVRKKKEGRRGAKEDRLTNNKKRERSEIRGEEQQGMKERN